MFHRKTIRLPMANEENEPNNLSLKRKRIKEAVEAVEKVSMPKADLIVRFICCWL